MSVNRLNMHYNFAAATLDVAHNDARLLDESFLMFRTDLRPLMTAFNHFTVKQLQLVAKTHCLNQRGLRKNELQNFLLQHVCETNSRCYKTLYTFKELPKPRKSNALSAWKAGSNHYRIESYNNIPVAPLNQSSSTSAEPWTDSSTTFQLPTQSSNSHAINTETNSSTPRVEHLKPISEDRMQKIIEEWQREMDPVAFLRKPCAACSYLLGPRDQIAVEKSSIDLRLLRNDGLDSNLRPKGYDFELFEGAILDPMGIEWVGPNAQLTLCKVCCSDLNRQRMPKLALCNWLYAAREHLPSNIQQAFKEMTVFEKALVCRVRTNSLLCRFIDREALYETKGEIENFPRGRRHIRGNIVSTPLDVMRVNEVLPPGPETIRDTMCAVMVSSGVPTTDTIKRLTPILVRKSRIKSILQFLTQNNPHYTKSDAFRGFDQGSLDALFEGDHDRDVPTCVKIAHLQPNHPVDSATSDYVGRLDDTDGLFMENVSYTLGDKSAFSYQEMTCQALNRCVAGKPFLMTRSGSQPVPDIGNPNWLSWAHPNADPFGISGFHHPKRTRPIGMEVQLRHQLNVRDSFFETDPELAFDIYNIIRKHTVNSSIRFSVPFHSYKGVVDDIKRIDREDLRLLRDKFTHNPMYKPTTPSERHIARVMTSIAPIARQVPGTVSQKIRMRNEIRSVISHRGCPTLFVTINPADYHNPIVTVLATRAKTKNQIAQIYAMSQSERVNTALNHPVACAQFFDHMINAFIRIVLRCGRRDQGPGLFGVCEGYYGVVETQGRGSLHCHMMVWLKGHLSPDELEHALKHSQQYRDRIIEWLDSITDSGFQGLRRASTDGSAAEKSDLSSHQHMQTGALRGPVASEMSPSEFSKEKAEFIDDLLLKYNWHVHTGTCWKYLGAKDARSPANCRFGLDGTIIPKTVVDPEKGLVILRRRHPQMTSFNPTLTFLMRCNTDIKFIGSGADAKAFMYYVTDYITKAPMSMHAGLTALSYAIQCGIDRGLLNGDSQDQETDRRAITLAVNSMLGKWEISHPLVMSFVLGTGESYTNSRFRAVNWAEIIRFVTKSIATSSHNLNERQEQYDEISMAIDRQPEGDQMSASSTLLDYTMRPILEPYNSYGLYEFIAHTMKSRRPPNSDGSQDTQSHSGSPNKDKAFFASRNHPQFFTHHMGQRRSPVLPVLLGPRVSKKGESLEERELWARDISILFRPWRKASDILSDGKGWYDTLMPSFNGMKPHIKTIIENMNLLADAKQARDERPRGRRRPEHAVTGIDTILESELERLESSSTRHIYALLQDTYSDNSNNLDNETHKRLEEIVGFDTATAFRLCHHETRTDKTSWQNYAMSTTSSASAAGFTDEDVRDQKRFMARCRYRNTITPPPDNDSSTTEPERLQSVQVRPETIMTVAKRATDKSPWQYRDDKGRSPDEIAGDIVFERCLTDNIEQMRAFNTVARHAIRRPQDNQLLLFVGGRGGTGKSHVISAIQALFSQLNRSHELRIGAPTGIAASLIGGGTIHSLIHIGVHESRSKDASKRLRDEWKGVQYLILDEVSMIGAQMMATLSTKLREAKGDYLNDSKKIFGGVNVIFMGDFHQLAPPRQPSLYSHKLVKDPSFALLRNNAGQDAMAGAHLWRQVSSVVILQKCVRQENDAVLSQILDHIRGNTCIRADGTPVLINGKSVLDHLRERQISSEDPTLHSQLPLFVDAPVIVGSKTVRDALNACMLNAHAKRLGVNVNFYYSQDTVKRQTPLPKIKRYLWNLPPRSTSEYLGILPLFIGMKVMVIENVSVDYKIVNGSEGTICDIRHHSDTDGTLYADVVYVQFHDDRCNIQVPGLSKGIVPLFPATVTITHDIHSGIHTSKSFRRCQIPIVPAYSYTDYKSQGRTLPRAIVDLASARGQGVYVMLSRVTSLQGLRVLRWFPSNRIHQRMSGELREEISRLNSLHKATAAVHQEWENLVA